MMFCAIIFVLFLALVVGAIFSLRTMRFALEGIIGLIVVLLVAQVASGAARLLISASSLMTIHRWAAQLLGVFCLTVATASIALLIRQFYERLKTSLQFLFLSFGAFFLIGLAHMSGYLRPFAPDTLEETRNRFLVLHCVALPGMAAAMAPIWISTLRRLCSNSPIRETAMETSHADDAVERARSVCPPDDNPYSSPRGD